MLWDSIVRYKNRKRCAGVENRIPASQVDMEAMKIRNDGIADRPIAPRGALPPDALPTGADGSPAAAVTAAPPHPQPQPQPQPQPHPQPSPLPQPQQHPSLLIWSCSVVAGQPALSNARGRTMGSPPISAVA